MYVYCVESFAHIECYSTVIVRAGGAIWLDFFAMVLFSVCSAVTVECCVNQRMSTTPITTRD